MRPQVQQAAGPSATAGGVEFRQWKSPIPFLFGGLALMLGVVAVALILLACSFKEASQSSNSSDNEKSQKPVHPLQPEMEPRVVVIMAGDTNPTYLAKPAAAVRRGEEV